MKVEAGRTSRSFLHSDHTGPWQFESSKALIERVGISLVASATASPNETGKAPEDNVAKQNVDQDQRRAGNGTMASKPRRRCFKGVSLSLVFLQ